MIVTCDKCGVQYDDAKRWTICPHNPLDLKADAVYCQHHDFFDCPICDPTKKTDAYGRVRPAEEKREQAPAVQSEAGRERAKRAEVLVALLSEMMRRKGAPELLPAQAEVVREAFELAFATAELSVKEVEEVEVDDVEVMKLEGAELLLHKNPATRRTEVRLRKRAVTVDVEVQTPGMAPRERRPTLLIEGGGDV